MANNAMNFVFAIADALQAEDEERKHAGLEPLEDLQKYLPMIIPLDGTKKRTETIMAILEAHDRKWPHTFVVCSPVTTFEASRQSALFWTEVGARPVLWLDESDQAFSHESCPLLEQFKCLKDVGLAALQSTCREVVHVSATIENDIAYLWANEMAVRYHRCDVARAQQLGDEAGSGLHLHSVCREQEFTIEGMRKAGGLVLSGVRDAFRTSTSAVSGAWRVSKSGGRAARSTARAASRTATGALDRSYAFRMTSSPWYAVSLATRLKGCAAPAAMRVLRTSSA